MDAAPFDPLQIQRHGILKRHAGHGKALLYPRRRQKPIERIPIPSRCRGRGRAPVPGGEGFGFAGPLSGGRRFPAIATGRSALHQLQRFPVSPIDGTEGTQRVFTSRGMKIRPSDLPLRLPFQLRGDLRAMSRAARHRIATGNVRTKTWAENARLGHVPPDAIPFPPAATDDRR